MYYAEVVLPLNLPIKCYYIFDEEKFPALTKGMAVGVYLRNKKYLGIVWNIVKEEPVADIHYSPIEELVFDNPVLNTFQIELWDWLSEYYMVSLGTIMQNALPTFLKLNSESVLRLEDDSVVADDATLSEHAIAIIEELRIQKKIQLKKLLQLIPKNILYSTINNLVEQKLVTLEDEWSKGFVPKKEKILLLNPDFNQPDLLEELLRQLEKNKEQRNVLLYFTQFQKLHTKVLKNTFVDSYPISKSSLQTLIKKNILVEEELVISRLRTTEEPLEPLPEMSLEQKKVYDELVHQWHEQQSCLLHGVTASGKTIIYMHFIQQALSENKQVLYVLPEILLTNELFNRLKKYFGNKIIPYHSRFSSHERAEIWNRVLKGDSLLILSTRSGIFLPYQHLEFIVVDEEHDDSHANSDPSFNYNVRDIALWLGHHKKSKILLGSATPSITTYFHAKNKKLGFVALHKKFSHSNIPSIEMVNLSQINSTYLEKELLTEEVKAKIQTTLDKGEQVIIFQNKRGFAPYILCKTCGHIPSCKFCDVKLVYHKTRGDLMCHYCGTCYAYPKRCLSCQSSTFEMKNFGTQKVEEKALQTFKDYSILRMDSDSFTSKNAYEKTLMDIHANKYSIIIGTQIIAKGIDYKNVGLIVVPRLDSMLSFHHFSANENAFQLLEQLKGRAGREKDAATIVVQTYQVHHPVLQFVLRGHYELMYNEEMLLRKQFFYPPYSKIIKILFVYSSQSVCARASKAFQEKLTKSVRSFSYAPVPSTIAKIKNKYRYEMLLKIPTRQNVLHLCKRELLHTKAKVLALDAFRNVQIYFVVDPKD